MSIKIMSTVWEHSQASGTELLLMLALADHANDHGLCWPSMKTLAKKTRVSQRTVSRLLNKLADTDELTIKQQPGKANLYRITVKTDPRQIVSTDTDDVTSHDKGDVTTHDTVVPKRADEPSIEPSLEPSLKTDDEYTADDWLHAVLEGKHGVKYNPDEKSELQTARLADSSPDAKWWRGGYKKPEVEPPADATPELVKEFYPWYREDTEGLALPGRKKIVEKWWPKFRVARLEKKQPVDDGVLRPGWSQEKLRQLAEAS